VSDAHNRNSAPGTTGRVLHWAARYDLMAWLFMLGRERSFREKLINLVGLRPGDVVLDVGCGTGTLAIVAKRHVGPSGSVHGVDASPEMIDRATKKARRAGVDVTFRTGVVEALPYPDAHFDVVLSTLMMHHLPRKARQECAHEIRRVAKPGGRVLVVDFGATPRGKKSFLGHFHRHGHVDRRDIMDVLVGAGLSVLESGEVGVRNLYFALATTPSLVSPAPVVAGGVS
jgi:ubiquinone/menaquinone biosynthesis C-methylase UbiE